MSSTSASGKRLLRIAAQGSAGKDIRPGRLSAAVDPGECSLLVEVRYGVWALRSRQPGLHAKVRERSALALACALEGEYLCPLSQPGHTPAREHCITKSKHLLISHPLKEGTQA